MTSADREPVLESEYARKTRARLLSAAERRFKHYGVAKTTIVDIAADCAMSHANVYRFFRNKMELIDALAAGWLYKSERTCREVVRRPLPAKQRLVDFVIELHRWKVREHARSAHVYEMLELANHAGRPFIAAHLPVLAAILVEIIEDGNRRAEFVVHDPQRFATIIQNATMKFCDPRLVAQYREEPLEAQARDVMGALLTSCCLPV